MKNASGCLAFIVSIIMIGMMGITIYKNNFVNEFKDMEKETKSIKAYKIETDETDNGSFSLIYEEAGSEKYYYFYIENGKEFSLQKLNKENVKIIKTDDKSPSITGYFDDKGEIFATEEDASNYLGSLNPDKKDINEMLQYSIYVPSNTTEQKLTIK